MRYKRGVVTVQNDTTDAMERAFATACRQVMGPDFEPECTSGIEGNHSAESGHYYGRAEDLGFTGRSRSTGKRKTIPETQRGRIASLTQGELNKEPSPAIYLVILESHHFHVQRQKDSF